MPPKDIRKVFSDLHIATKARQFAVAATEMRFLLQISKMSEPMLLQVITPQEEAEASQFWWNVLGVKFPTARETVVKSAHAYYAVMYRAGEDPRMLSMREQARQYCEHIAEVCEQYLVKPSA